MLVRSAKGDYEFIDFRETAPAAATEDMYTKNVDASIHGGLASGVPGELRGLEHLHKRYGKLSWKEVVMPAVHVARNGFKVTKDTVRYMASATTGARGDFLTYDPTWALDFAPNGTRVGLGDTLKRKRYADTLQDIAECGPDAFYSGPIANATVQATKASNGILTLDDLKDYKVAIREPSSIEYRGYKLKACSAPSGGTVALSALKILEGYNVDGAKTVNLTAHRVDESMRWAYGERANLGDPSFTANVTAYEKRMLLEETVEEVRKGISNTRSYGVAHYDPAGLESLETVSRRQTTTLCLTLFD